MTYFSSAQIYIECGRDLRDKINRLNAVITALETTALKAAETGNLDEYSLDDGQTKIRTKYRDAVAVANSITAFETIRQRYINQLNGRHVRLADSKNYKQWV